MITFIPFSGIGREGGEHGPDGLGDVSNVVHVWGGWHTFAKPIDSESAVSADHVNASCIHKWPASAGTTNYVGDLVTEFHGTRTALYVRSGGAFTAISRGGGYAAAGSPSSWSFASFGNDVWASNYIDEMQRRTNNTGNFANGITSSFAPEARFIAPVRTQMFAAGLSNVGRYDDEVAWSVVGNAANYDPGGGGLAGSQRILSCPGQIMGLVGGQYARILKRSSFHIMSWTANSVSPWREDVVSDSIGTPYPRSIVKAKGGAIYFWGGDAFYSQEGLAAPVKVSPDGLNSYLVDYDFNLSRALNRAAPLSVSGHPMLGEDNRMIGAQDPTTGTIIWLYMDPNDSSYLTGKGVFFNPGTGSWSRFEPSTETFSSLISSDTLVTYNTLLWEGLVATRWDGANIYRTTFRSSTQHAAQWATKRFALALDGQDRPRVARVKGVLPVLGTKVANTANQEMAALPAGTTVKVWAAEDPHFLPLTDEAGTKISPRSDSYTPTSASDSGWLPFALQGKWWLFEMTTPETTTVYRSAPGLYIDWEPVL